MAKKYLMLEDKKERTPQVIANYTVGKAKLIYEENEWIIVRNYDEFVDWILKNGLPDVISFDHDLADEHYAFAGNYNIFREKTGYDAAKWLVEFCMYEKLQLPEYYVHSMNVVGKENIINYLENYRKNEAKDISDRSSTSSSGTGNTI